MKRALIAMAAALTLSACETVTPYQPIVAHNAKAAGGYSEQQIEANRWRVEFAGNSLTSRQVVERYLLFRSAQLTVAQGYDWFQSVDRHTDRQTDYYGGGDPFFGGGYGGFGGGYGGFGPGFGYGGFGYGPYGGGFGGFGYGYGGFGGGGAFDIDQVNRYQSTVEVLMGHGQKPANNAHAYDARSVIEHLQGTIQYPKT